MYEYNMTPNSKLMGYLKWTFFMVFMAVIITPITSMASDAEFQLLFLFFIVMSLVSDFMTLILTYSLNQYVIEDIEKEIENEKTTWLDM